MTPLPPDGRACLPPTTSTPVMAVPEQTPPRSTPSSLLPAFPPTFPPTFPPSCPLPADTASLRVQLSRHGTPPHAHWTAELSVPGVGGRLSFPSLQSLMDYVARLEPGPPVGRPMGHDTDG